MTDKDFNKTMGELTMLQRNVELRELELRPLKARIDELKFDLLNHLKQIRSKRTDPFEGYYLLKQQRANVLIENREAMDEWLVKRGYAVSDYYTPDNSKLKELIERDGEMPDGVQASVTEYVSVKKAKE